ncbi:MAG: hypothetical protein M0R03_16725 [Novosphingobium sp.]|nr:hypothetical protein [Novosphingobium sp.]
MDKVRLDKASLLEYKLKLRIEELGGTEDDLKLIEDFGFSKFEDGSMVI